MKPLQRARIGCPHILPSPPIVRQLGPKRAAQLGDVFSLLNFLHDLLAPKRDQHAQDDHPDLAEKFAPAAQRLEQLEPHRLPPGAR
jgi:hypothetical protein